ncbi:MAG: dihydropteroate synthase [bacterium]|nr:dihydropteroate synthase [bacterium]
MQTKVMGVLEVAPDAPAGGPPAVRNAVARGRNLISEGADIVEVACVPDAPGRPAVRRAAEARQVRSVVSTLTGDVRIAVRTDSATVAAAAAAAGATLIVDDSTTRLPAAPAASLPALAAEAGVGWVAVCGPGGPARRSGAGNGRPSVPGSLLGEAAEVLLGWIGAAEAAGVGEIYIDPGIGAGRAVRDDLDVLGGLGMLEGLGRPLVVGTGDGRLIDALHASADTAPAPPAGPEGTVGERDGGPDAGRRDRGADRLEGALAVAVWAMLAGAAIIRTHDVAATVDAARVVGAKAPVGSP